MDIPDFLSTLTLKNFRIKLCDPFNRPESSEHGIHDVKKLNYCLKATKIEQFPCLHRFIDVG